MFEILMASIIVLGVAAVMVGFGFLAVHLRERGTAGPAIAAAMAAYDEAMHGTAYNTFVEVEAQKDRTVTAPRAE